MTVQKLEVLSQEITDLKALKDKSILINGEGHYITHQIAKATQSLFNLVELNGNTPISTLSTTIDNINTIGDVQNYLVNYKSTASDNAEFFLTEVLFDLGQEFIVKKRIGDYLVSIIDAAHYN